MYLFMHTSKYTHRPIHTHNHSVLQHCIWCCEHARFCVEVFYVLYINFHSFIHCWKQYFPHKINNADPVLRHTRLKMQTSYHSTVALMAFFWSSFKATSIVVCLCFFFLYACILLLLICIIMGICALYVFLWVVKRFEIPKALYKFPIIIIIKTSFAREVSLLVTEF